MAEATPLLHDVTDDRHLDEFDTQTEACRHAYYKRPIRLLTIATLVLCVITILLLIVDFIIIKKAPFSGPGYYTWSAGVGCEEFGILIFVALLFSSINVLIDFPILLNVIVDIVIVSLTIPRLVHYIERFPNSGWCDIQQYPTPRPPHPKCADWRQAAMYLSIVIAVLGGIICVTYLILLLLRIVTIVKGKYWKRPLTYFLPTGKISLEISLNVVGREGNGSNSGQRLTADAGSSSGHGPLYL